MACRLVPLPEINTAIGSLPAMGLVTHETDAAASFLDFADDQ